MALDAGAGSELVAKFTCTAVLAVARVVGATLALTR
jgi:hypothetical protein